MNEWMHAGNGRQTASQADEGRQADKQPSIRTDMQAGRRASRQASRRTCRKAGKQARRHMYFCVFVFFVEPSQEFNVISSCITMGTSNSRRSWDQRARCSSAYRTRLYTMRLMQFTFCPHCGRCVSPLSSLHCASKLFCRVSRGN